MTENVSAIKHLRLDLAQLSPAKRHLIMQEFDRQARPEFRAKNEAFFAALDASHQEEPNGNGLSRRADIYSRQNEIMTTTPLK